MRILILGGTGMIGHRLWLELSKNFDTFATVRTESPFDLPHVKGVDFYDMASIRRALCEVKPDFVINCAGIIKQLGDASNYIKSIHMNAMLPHLLAEECKKVGARLLQFGTDCAFDGRKGMYLDDEPGNATDLYGRTKYLGEIANESHVVTVRTSVIGRELSSQSGLVEWFLSQSGKEIKGFSNAIYTGFPVKTFASIIKDFIIPNDFSGVYNISSNPISKYDLLQLVNEVFDAKISIVKDDTFYMDRSLDSTKFRDKFGFRPQSWESMVQDIRIDDDLYQSFKR